MTTIHHDNVPGLKLIQGSDLVQALEYLRRLSPDNQQLAILELRRLVAANAEQASLTRGQSNG